MKILDSYINKITTKAIERCSKIADLISEKTNTNVFKAMDYLSDWIDEPRVYRSSTSSKNKIVYEVSLIGKQVAFLEFGTGVQAANYPVNYSGKIQHGQGTYGEKGNNEHWVFVPRYTKNVSLVNGDKVYDYRVYHRKKDGGVSIYPLKNPIIYTHGIQPQRMLYNAIRETIKEVERND